MSDDVENLKKLAWTSLRKPGGDPHELYELAGQLKNRDCFGLARRIAQRALEVHHGQLAPPPTVVAIAQRAVLCTYKDPDLPRAEALERALRILQEYDPPGTSTDQETLGLAGAIYKRKWQETSAKQHLEQSLAYYLRGYHQGVAKDDGYTAINAAYILDLLSSLEERNARDVGETSETAALRRKEAEEIRIAVVAALEPKGQTLGNQWWFVATIAEAYFGLRRYDEARVWLRRVTTIRPPDWELESTARQLAHLAELQLDDGIDLSTTEAWRVVEELLGGDAEAVRSVFHGKLGLALSGGGFRASLFHIGVLARLAELDLLRHVHVLSCVSGGSILGAYYYLEVRKLLEQKGDTATKDDYVAITRRMAEEFLAGVQQNLRMRMVGSIKANVRMILSGTYSRTTRLGELYESLLYARVEKQIRLLRELRIAPGGDTSFEPKRQNWRRRNKVPMLVLNATTLNTGHNWQYTASWMGESPYSIDPEVDGNWRLRRLYHTTAPGRWSQVPIGEAVGASACVPGLFEPIVMTKLYPKDDKDPKITVRLVDGGVHDNQGIASLLEQDCSVLIVSDASGQMTSSEAPGGGVINPLLRTNTILMERVRLAQFQDLKARLRASLLKGLAILHLKKDLPVTPVDWKGCEEPADTPLQRQGDLLPYGILPDMQQKLAGIRTDLDSFSDIEAHALMTSGYLMAETYVASLGSFPVPRNVARGDWDFLDVAKPLESVNDPDHARVKEHLEVGSQKAFKIWRLSRPLRITSQVLMALVVLLFALACWQFPTAVLVDLPLVGWNFTVGELGSTVLWTVLGLWLGKKVVDLLQFKQTIRRVLMGIALALGGGIGAQIHLRVFDPLFLRLGSLPRRSKGEPRDDQGTPNGVKPTIPEAA